MGGIVKSLFKKPQVDKSALYAAQENQRRAQEEARRAEAKRIALEEAEKNRQAGVKSSGRMSTILAGENETGGKTLLGD